MRPTGNGSLDHPEHPDRRTAAGVATNVSPTPAAANARMIPPMTVTLFTVTDTFSNSPSQDWSSIWPARACVGQTQTVDGVA